MRWTLGNKATRSELTHGYAGEKHAGNEGLIDAVLHASRFLRSVEGSLLRVREGFLQILSGVHPYVPQVRVFDRRDGLHVMADLPGIEESSVEVVFEGRFLKIRGVKIDSKEHKRRKYRRVVKVYRNLERSIPMDSDADRDHAVATLRNAVLSVHVPVLAPASPVSGSSAPAPESSPEVPDSDARASSVPIARKDPEATGYASGDRWF